MEDNRVGDCHGGGGAGRPDLADRVFQELDRRARGRRRRAGLGGVALALIAAAIGGSALLVDPGASDEASKVAALSVGERRLVYDEMGQRLRLDGDPSALAGLRAGLSDPDPKARRKATSTLLRSVARRRDSNGVARDVRVSVESLIVALGRPIEVSVATDGDPWALFVETADLTNEEQTLCVLVLLEDVSESEIVPYVPFVLTQIEHPESGRIRGQALRTARSTMPDWPDLQVVVKGFMDAGTADEKISAIQAVHAGEMLELSGELRALLADADPQVRVWSAQTLAALGVTAAAADLTGLVDDPADKVRIHAASALSRLGFPEWNSLLVDLASGSAASGPVSSRDRAEALRELRQVSEIQAAEVGMAVLFASASAASAMGVQENSTFYGAAASTDSRLLIILSIRSSVLWPGPEAAAMISAWMDDEDPMLVVEASEALHRLGVAAGTERLIEWIIGSDHPGFVRRLAITVAERLADPVFKPALEQVEQGDAAAANRAAASEALQGIEAGPAGG